MKVYGPDSVLLVTINVITVKDAKACSGNLSCLKSSGGGGGGGSPIKFTGVIVVPFRG